LGEKSCARIPLQLSRIVISLQGEGRLLWRPRI
jgi:hypothetical protein